jgi:ATP-dependent helicase YprA (DUF1998 family)
MDVFEMHGRLVADYDAFTSSLVEVRDRRIDDHLQEQRRRKVRWPHPYLSLNPGFESGGTIEELVVAGLLDEECERLFRVKTGPEDPGEHSISLHRHQREAIEAARTGRSYVVTTGTGSGKSLTYLIPIVNAVLTEPARGHIKAIVVYPMNALANSQLHELEKFLVWGILAERRRVTFARYTGQEDEERRRHVLNRPPDILLTNYVMLEYLLTRPLERRQLIGAARGLRFLVLDELHTYRGRQGADVALLVRRLRDACQATDLQCVGTSATMATDEHPRETVAMVASQVFGTEVDAAQVIGESLRRAAMLPKPSPSELRRGIEAALAGRRRSYAELAADPMAGWIESTFGLGAEDATGRLVRRRPTTVAEEAATLATSTGRPKEQCQEAIEKLLQEGAAAQSPEHGRPLFAFRLHQFFSKGDTVYVSLEPEEQRHVTSQYQVSVPGHSEKLLLPLAFCRECGQEYLVVAKATRHGEIVYQPRQDRDAAGGDEANGYLYVSTEQPWPADPLRDGRLPDTWYSTDPVGEAYILPRLAPYLPRRIWLAPDGHELPQGRGLEAAYVPSPFRFCLRCRVAYEQVRGRDFAKLATFAAEGRSSAVSLLSTSVVRGLRRQEGLDDRAKKLLTFVDNRQDASLQAGHLNDFVQVTQVRGALYRAVADADAGLHHHDVAQHVERALGLAFEEFARNPEVRFSQRDLAREAFRKVLEYRLYCDLERGWRVTMPNLEQTGLLTFAYTDLDQIAAEPDCWGGTHPALRTDGPEHRADLARIVLDEMRRALAVDVDVLTQEGFERLQQMSEQHLTGPWALPGGEARVSARTVFARPGGKGGSRDAVHYTGRSALGRYLRQPGQFPAHGVLDVPGAQAVIADLLQVLERYGLLTAMSENGGWGPGYRLKASAVIWQSGDGKTGAPDPLRKTVDPEAGLHVNVFFHDLYVHTATELRGLVAREHTAQVRADDRMERERAFRDAELPLLFCSPTMELGVDIAELNAVQMRNVPPSPANYAQRSGRAGRGGQPALVTTYCSTGSAHDQYYFRRSHLMVGGSVAPPRLDMANEDLIRSHIHAIWLAETGADLGSRMTDVLTAEGEEPALDLNPPLATQLADPAARRRAAERGREVLRGLEPRLRDTTWWHEQWIEDTLCAAAERFDEACDRWRQLYRGALAEQREQNRRVLDHSTSPEARREAQRRRTDAEHQLRLLQNEDEEAQYSDFYSYRYLASEGFLPGYAFPRLPLAAYVPGERRGGTYIQRPRFIAVGEFGPGALIYHEGQRYQVTRVQMPTGAERGDVATREARICAACGHWHDRRAGVDVCQECGAELGSALAGLMQLQTVHTVRRRRISSDEEERRRAGFELNTSYQFSLHGTRLGRMEAAVTTSSGQPLATLVYGDAATVRVVNVGRRRRKDPDDLGFWLDLSRGRWLSEQQAADRVPEDEGLAILEDVAGVAKVVPYVEDRKNVMVVRLAQPVPAEAAVTLRHALERGIEATFQLEDVELTSEGLPDPEGRARMLFIESAEGGAGVLRQLHDEPAALAAVARSALEIVHYDPVTGADLGKAPGASERCERGCYDCLLSYTNQPVHQSIDRHTAVDILRQLMEGRVEPSSHRPDRDHLAALAPVDGGDGRRRLLDLIREGGYRLPDQAGQPAAGAHPDFIYRLDAGNVAIFLEDPGDAQDQLVDQGWLVIRFDQDASAWDELLRGHPGVFGPGRRRG